jgi:CRP-like cAMP-binding protein
VGENFLFQELDEETLQAVVMAMGERSVAEGEAVVTQGEASSCFYVVESGSLSIYKYDQEADPTPEGPGALSMLPASRATECV